MARFEAQRKMGFYPTPQHLVSVVASYLHVADPENTFILDPCAGTGEALQLLGQVLGVKRLFANELDEARAQECREAGLTAVCGDCVHELKATESYFSLLWLNPDYDNEGEGQGRTEMKFLRTLRFLRRSGVLVYIVPLAVLRRNEFRARLPLLLKDITVCRFPDPDFNAFGQAVLFGRKSAGRSAVETKNYERQINSPLVLGDGQSPACGLYNVPPADPRQQTCFYSTHMDEDTQELLFRLPIVQRLLRHGLSKDKDREVRTLMPLRCGHQLMVLASGVINGIYRDDKGNLIALAGSTGLRTTEMTEVEGEKTTRTVRSTPTAKVLGLALTETLHSGQLTVISYE